MPYVASYMQWVKMSPYSEGYLWSARLEEHEYRAIAPLECGPFSDGQTEREEVDGILQEIEEGRK